MPILASEGQSGTLARPRATREEAHAVLGSGCLAARGGPTATAICLISRAPEPLRPQPRPDLHTAPSYSGVSLTRALFLPKGKPFLCLRSRRSEGRGQHPKCLEEVGAEAQEGQDQAAARTPSGQTRGHRRYGGPFRGATGHLDRRGEGTRREVPGVPGEGDAVHLGPSPPTRGLLSPF